jgi:hypothetical protein
MILRAKGTEIRGSGGASGTVTTTLREENGATTVDMASQVDVTGRVAQFGRGIMQDVSNRLIRDFARCLESQLSADAVNAEETLAPTEEVVQPTTSASSESEVIRETVPASSMPTPETGRLPTPAMSPPRPPQPTTEIRPMQLLADVARSRLAQLLRLAASRIEPKS